MHCGCHFWVSLSHKNHSGHWWPPAVGWQILFPAVIGEPTWMRVENYVQCIYYCCIFSTQSILSSHSKYCLQSLGWRLSSWGANPAYVSFLLGNSCFCLCRFSCDNCFVPSCCSWEVRLHAFSTTSGWCTMRPEHRVRPPSPTPKLIHVAIILFSLTS